MRSWPVLVLLVSAFCGACRASFQDECDPGTDGCECIEDACVAGLACLDGICVGGGDTDGENLLSNPGFEEWNEGSPVSWMVVGSDAWEQTEDSPQEGELAVRVTSGDYGGVSQTIHLPEVQPAGSTFTASAFARHVEGDGAHPFVSIQLGYVDGTEPTLVSNAFPNFDGTAWGMRSVSAEAAADVDPVNVSISIGQNALVQTVDVDAVLLLQTQ
jgi:hypothetical protein